VRKELRSAWQSAKRPDEVGELFRPGGTSTLPIAYLSFASSEDARATADDEDGGPIANAWVVLEPYRQLPF
jgi:hypothetical protein